MKKRVKIIISLLCVMCIGIFGTVMTGCNNDENTPEIYEPPKNCDVVLESGVGYEEDYREFMTICNTYDELKEQFYLHGYESFESDKVCQYINEHSEDKSLAVCFYVVPAHYGDHRIKEIEVEIGRAHV